MKEMYNLYNYISYILFSVFLRIVIMYLIKNLPDLFKNTIETRIIKKHFEK